MTRHCTWTDSCSAPRFFNHTLEQYFLIAQTSATTLTSVIEWQYTISYCLHTTGTPSYILSLHPTPSSTTSPPVDFSPAQLDLGM